ncbi:hypothetical protein BCR37DRAFT_392152 [Protomyces lactucae-debilis]|uniref:Xylanolytic transcriptional activator regulatory domain-containing protein n=1 Tax=Protomyces lactucae-debilis TaxID=2754530 RepID=A0A1Y2FIA6_PROLT|nr:uncharacterized protein BCR37DRAFT_392152 [Protomyces lactucae-debilis]ORY83681.1 hypothetical protein BCR37DRAFT_392152 [Protomyces lactucae-debilis]
MHARKEQDAAEAEADSTSESAPTMTANAASSAMIQNKKKRVKMEALVQAEPIYTSPYDSQPGGQSKTSTTATTPAMRSAIDSPVYHARQPPTTTYPRLSSTQPPPLQPVQAMLDEAAASPHIPARSTYSLSVDKTPYNRETQLDYAHLASIPWQQPQYVNFPPDINHGVADDVMQLQGSLDQSRQQLRWPAPSGESFVRGSAPGIPEPRSNMYVPVPQPYYNGDSLDVSTQPSEPAMNRWLMLNQHNNPVTNLLNISSQPNTTANWGIPPPSNKGNGNINDARYAKIEQGFYGRLFSHGKWAIAEKRWYDVLHGGTEDLFASCDPTCELPLVPGQRARVSEACRLRMMRALFPESRNPYDPASKLDYTGDLLSGFPTCSDFDQALDTYFERFTKEAPFFHIGVFSISTCDPLLLMTMACVGFGLGQTESGNHFVQSNFDGLKNRIMGDLEGKLNGITLDAISGFATAFIFLKLAALFADRDHLTPCQMMYICMVSIAQTHGIFTDYGRKVTSGLFSQFSSVETTWKAWGRVESLKRIIVSMLRSDSAYCTFLRTAPVIRVNNIEMLLPCDDLLFDAPNADVWWAIVQGEEHPIIMPALSSHNSLDKLVGHTFLNYYSLHTVLNYLSLRGADAAQKLQDYQSIHRETEPFVPVPYDLYIRDETGRNMVHHLISFIDNFQSLLPSFPQDWQRTNCLVFWHYLCLSLTMNSDLLEITAGRSGGQAASFAARYTKKWVQTPAARRALLHSAQVYQLLANKQQTDMRSIYACFAVFQAALVMTLYVFASQPASTNGSGTKMLNGSGKQDVSATETAGFELTEPLDWAGMGSVGLDHAAALNGTPAAQWIAVGGPWQFSGKRLDGFAGAIYLLDIYSDLLKTCGKWNYASMHKILVSMRDLLTRQ